MSERRFNSAAIGLMAEALLNRRQAEEFLFALPTWASSTDTTPDYQLTMGAQFNRQIGFGNIKRMGDLGL